MNKEKIRVTLIGKCDEEHYIIAKVRKALKSWGRHNQALKYEEEIKKANNWEEVMLITSKYVEIV